MTRLHITIDLDGPAFADGGSEVSRVLRRLAGRIDTYGTEYVAEKTLNTTAGDECGEVWLSSDADSSARYLSDMARHSRTFEMVADPDNLDDEAEMAGGLLSAAVGYYLAAIGHPEAPAFAKGKLNKS